MGRNGKDFRRFVLCVRRIQTDFLDRFDIRQDLGSGNANAFKSGGGNVKILLPETELQGFAGSGEQREAAGCPTGHTLDLAQEYVQEKTCIFIHVHALSYQRH